MEPIPHTYQRLVENTKKWPNVTTIQSSLSANGGYYEGVETMFCLKDYDTFSKEHPHLDEEKKHNADEFCSFDKKHITKHFPSGTVVEVSVSAMTMTVLLAMYGVENIHVVIMDTEGFDGALIEAFPFSSVTPPLLVYEHTHLSRQEVNAANTLLTHHCYHIFASEKEDGNSYAVHKDFMKFAV